MTPLQKKHKARYDKALAAIISLYNQIGTDVIGGERYGRLHTVFLCGMLRRGHAYFFKGEYNNNYGLRFCRLAENIRALMNTLEKDINRLKEEPSCDATDEAVSKGVANICELLGQKCPRGMAFKISIKGK